MYLHYGTTLLVGQSSVADGGSKTADKDGWRYPNGTWVTAADVGWKCGLAWKPGDPYIPCLFDEMDLREQHDLAPGNRSVVEELWLALNKSLLTQFTARSPAALLGPCDKACAAKHWKTFGGGGAGPTCGVPGCANPGPPPAPPQPQPGPGHGPFVPVNASNCTYRGDLGSGDGTGTRVSGVASTEHCCRLCFQSNECVLATYIESKCFLHSTTGKTKHAAGVTGLITGRIPLLG